MSINKKVKAPDSHMVAAIVKRIWAAEEHSDLKSGSEKHAYVKGFFIAYIEDHNLILSDIDGLISDIVISLHKHDIFLKAVQSGNSAVNKNNPL